MQNGDWDWLRESSRRGRGHGCFDGQLEWVSLFLLSSRVCLLERLPFSVVAKPERVVVDLSTDEKGGFEYGESVVL